MTKSPNEIPVKDATADRALSLTAMIQSLMLAAIVGLGVNVNLELRGVGESIVSLTAALAETNRIASLDSQKMLSMNAQLIINTNSLHSRDNIRWNQPDMIRWIQSTKRMNSGWKPAPALNKILNGN